jgi:hypothetical protein
LFRTGLGDKVCESPNFKEGETTGFTLGAGTGRGVSGTLGGARGRGEGAAAGVAVSKERTGAGAGEGKETARPRISATLAKALRIRGPNERGVVVAEVVAGFRR